MTRSTGDRPAPGTTLLKIAPRLFSERFVSAAVLPTIADLQAEVAAAGESRVARLLAQWRGYRAFWMLMLAAPFASWAAPGGNDDAAGAGMVRRVAASTAIFTLLALADPLLGLSVAVLVSAGALFAISIHAWCERHPSDIPAPPEPAWRSPQINFSSTDVAGNIGGLIFVVGSLFVVSLALPSVMWFLVAGTIAGCLVAWRLAAWHTSHPKAGLPENRIVLR